MLAIKLLYYGAFFLLDSGWQIHELLLSFFISWLWSSAVHYLQVTKEIFLTAIF